MPSFEEIIQETSIIFVELSEAAFTEKMDPETRLIAEVQALTWIQLKKLDFIINFLEGERRSYVMEHYEIIARALHASAVGMKAHLVNKKVGD